MKAVIAAGGMGTRLSSIAKNIPKALVKVGDKPVIEHQITLLKKHGIEEIHLLLGYLGGQIKEYLGNGEKYGVLLHYHQESSPLGTAGALANIQEELADDFLFISGDVMMNFDVRKFIQWHTDKKDSVASLAVHPTDHPEDSDLVQISDNHRVARLATKPHAPGVNLQNLGVASVAILSPKIISYVPKGVKSNFEKDVLCQALDAKEAIYAYNTPEYIKDMGTPERLKKVNDDYFAGKIQTS